MDKDEHGKTGDRMCI